MSDQTVAVFGGTGFLGRRVVRHLLDKGFSVRVVSRHPQSSGASARQGSTPIFADIHDERSVASAIAGAQGVVNAVSLYVEHGVETFHAVHVEGAGRLARLAKDCGVRWLVQVSGIGSDAGSFSLYIRKRGEGELAVRAQLPGAIIVRPSVMFGPDDVFLNTIVRLLRWFPVYPMFGRGETRLQPAYVEDVGEAIARRLQASEAPDITYELGGPHIYTYEQLLRTIAGRINRSPMLVPVPFAAWHALARMTELLPKPALTRNQVELMELDTIAAAGMAGFGALGIAPLSIDHVLDQIAPRAAAAVH
ncbi:MAG: complex I NDUFA9 subunit family protein [Hyphomicrobium sp.]|nr:complex I NDUFA9 subunit family protein [Hyphomicrobium sp.]